MKECSSNHVPDPTTTVRNTPDCLGAGWGVAMGNGTPTSDGKECSQHLSCNSTRLSDGYGFSKDCPFCSSSAALCCLDQKELQPGAGGKLFLSVFMYLKLF